MALTAGSYLDVRPSIKQRRRIWIGPVYVYMCALYLQAEGPVIGSIDIFGTRGSASLPLWLPRCYFRGISVHEIVIKKIDLNSRRQFR
jgi:hypothetical protein